MAKKKALRKDTQSMVITIAVLILSIGMIGAVSIMATVNQMSDTVATVNGEKITRPYYNFFLYNQKLYYESFGGADIWSYSAEGQPSTEDSAKDSALNTAISMKLSKQQAQVQSLALTPEDETQIATNITDTKTTLGEEAIRLIGLTDETLKEIFTDQILGDKLYEEVTKDFELNPEDFETYYQDYLAQNAQTLTQINGDVIHTDTLEEAMAAQEQINGGADFVEVLKQVSADYDAAAEYAATIVTAGLYPQQVVDAAFALTEGQVSEVIEVEESGAYIVRVNTITPPDETTLRPEQETEYTNQQKQQIFDTQFSAWSGEATLDTNNDLISALRIRDISPAATPTPLPSFDPALNGTVDPATDATVDPATGETVDPATGETVDPAASEDASTTAEDTATE